MQDFAYLRDGVLYNIQLPPRHEEVVPNVHWGDPCALFSPAYWYTQYLMGRPAIETHVTFRIAQTFNEELTACLLGAHGVEAEIAMAAFVRLRDEGLIADLCANQARLENSLSAPLTVGRRQVRYRFWHQKAKYLAAIYDELKTRILPIEDALLLRRELMNLPGIGPKTASWIVRNWNGSDDVAILDIHIVRAGVLAGLYSMADNVTRDYDVMESRFVAFAYGLRVPTSTLDVMIWSIMRRTPRLVSRMLSRTYLSP